MESSIIMMAQSPFPKGCIPLKRMFRSSTTALLKPLKSPLFKSDGIKVSGRLLIMTAKASQTQTISISSSIPPHRCSVPEVKIEANSNPCWLLIPSHKMWNALAINFKNAAIAPSFQQQSCSKGWPKKPEIALSKT